MTDDLLSPKSVTRDLLSIKATEAICRLITSQELKPGDRIPSERELSEQLQIGRNTLRAALAILEKEGIITRQLGKGTFLCKNIFPEQLDVKLCRINYQELLEIKIWLDELAIRRASRYASAEQRENLYATAQQLQASLNETGYSKEADRAFHLQLLDCSGSDMLRQLALSMVDTLNGYAGMLPNADTCWRATIPYHLDIAQALKDGNLSFALAALQYIYHHDLLAMKDMQRPEAEIQKN